MENNNLDTFKILFLVKGILTLLFSLFPLLYVFMGGFFYGIIEVDRSVEEIPFNPGIIFIVIGILGFIFLLTLAILTLLASKYLGERKNYTFVFVIAMINCITGILGILLGIFSLIELSKAEVKALFQENR